MDITKLKNYLKNNIKYIIICLVIFCSYVGFSLYVNNLDEEIAICLVNDDLLTRSIDEENYVINHKVIFDEEKLKNNLEELLNENKLNVSFKVTVNENNAIIYINNKELKYEISPNIN